MKREEDMTFYRKGGNVTTCKALFDLAKEKKIIKRIKEKKQHTKKGEKRVRI